MSTFSNNLPYTPQPFGQPIKLSPGLYDLPRPLPAAPGPFDNPRRFSFERSLESTLPGRDLELLRLQQVNHLMCFGRGSQP